MRVLVLVMDQRCDVVVGAAPISSLLLKFCRFGLYVWERSWLQQCKNNHLSIEGLCRLFDVCPWDLTAARYMQMNHTERIDYLKKLFDNKMSKACNCGTPKDWGICILFMWLWVIDQPFGKRTDYITSRHWLYTLIQHWLLMECLPGVQYRVLTHSLLYSKFLLTHLLVGRLMHWYWPTAAMFLPLFMFWFIKWVHLQGHLLTWSHKARWWICPRGLETLNEEPATTRFPCLALTQRLGPCSSRVEAWIAQINTASPMRRGRLTPMAVRQNPNVPWNKADALIV